MRKIFVVVVLMVALTALHAQKPTDWILLHFAASDTARSDAHSYALEGIKSYLDYQNASDRNWVSRVFYFASPIGTQTIGVDNKTGMPNLENISQDDAFLLLYSEQLRQMLQRQKLSDDEDAAMRSIPPAKLKTPSKTFKVQSVPEWNSQILADTNCTLNRVRLVDLRLSKKDSLMHELMHVATGCNGDAYLHRDITLLAPALLKLMRENPAMVEYLMKPLKETQP